MPLYKEDAITAFRRYRVRSGTLSARVMDREFSGQRILPVDAPPARVAGSIDEAVHPCQGQPTASRVATPQPGESQLHTPITRDLIHWLIPTLGIGIFNGRKIAPVEFFRIPVAREFVRHPLLALGIGIFNRAKIRSVEFFRHIEKAVSPSRSIKQSAFEGRVTSPTPDPFLNNQFKCLQSSRKCGSFLGAAGYTGRRPPEFRRGRDVILMGIWESAHNAWGFVHIAWGAGQSANIKKEYNIYPFSDGGTFLQWFFVSSLFFFFIAGSPYRKRV